MKNLISKLVVIQTVTNFYSGQLQEIEDGFLRLSNPAWIADTGRATDFYADPNNAREVEVFQQDFVYIAVGSVVTAYEVSVIPTSQKG